MNLTDTARRDQQVALENLSVELGVARYREALAQEGTGALPPGTQLIKAAMGPMIEALKGWLEETGAGLASRNAGVYYFINQLAPETSAWITAQTAIAHVEGRQPVTRAAMAVAANLEASINVEAITAANPALGKKVERQVAKMSADRNKLVFIRKGAELADVKVIQWEPATRVRIGTLLLELFARSTGLIAMDVVPTGRGKVQMVMRATEACTRWLEEAHARCELLSPVRLPMVCKPRDWTNPFNGGYLSPQLRQPMVKTRNKGYLTTLKDHDMPWVYAAVNTLQATEWAVNVQVYEVVKDLWESNREVASLPTREKLPLPAKTWAEGETPAPEVLHAWKVDAAKTYEANAKSESKRLQVVQKLWVAEMMMERGNRFHYVYNLDWRGRMYPVGPALTPQGDDLAKGMLCFSRGMALGADGAYWLAIHGANTFGVDKVSFEERISWIEANTDMILAVAANPLAERTWEEADSPFCFLAFCFEWAKLQAHVDAGLPEAAFISHLAVAFDGACNGLQNFSAMLRDPVGGAATGLVPNEKPSDIYSEVARAAQAIIDRDAAGLGPAEELGAHKSNGRAQTRQEIAKRWVGKMTRKLAKRNTMTVPYGVTRRGMRDQLFAELKDSLSEHRAADADYLAAVNFEAIGNVVVAAREAMDWLKEAAKVAASTELPVRWVTPAGFLAVQDYRDDVGEALDFTVMGRRFQLMLNKTGDKLSTRKQALGISPNFVHSLDAAHLMRTTLFCAQDGIVDFAMIHDSYGVHAGASSLLRNNLRAAFVEQYSEPVLANFRDQLLEQLPEDKRGELPTLPQMGSLDLEQVRQSEYFFA